MRKIVFVAALAIISLACVSTVPTVAPLPTVELPTLTPLPTLPPATNYVVTASFLYVRNADGLVIAWLANGDRVACVPTLDGWCWLSNSSRVWQGCLSEPMGKECKEK